MVYTPAAETAYQQVVRLARRHITVSGKTRTSVRRAVSKRQLDKLHHDHIESLREAARVLVEYTEPEARAWDERIARERAEAPPLAGLVHTLKPFTPEPS